MKKTSGRSAKREMESVGRIEPARLDEPTAAIADVIGDLAATSATLDKALELSVAN
jgi:hypothetical protein